MNTANRFKMVQLQGVHLCCGGCVDAAAEGVAKVPGVAFDSDMERGTITLRGPDEAALQQALDAIGDAGLYGKTGQTHLGIRTDANLPAGKVQRVMVSGIHNCCDLYRPWR